LPRLILAAGAVRGLDRCRRFLHDKSPSAARRAAAAIARHLSLLESSPEIGRPSGDPPLRELVIPFGDSGYVALYRHEPSDDAVYLLAFRHQREAGYPR
jgi:plasmid stabilization system protein ParE